MIESIQIIDLLVEKGCKKINFAGGEPTLINHLSNLVNYSKGLGLFVSIISNGTGVSKEFLNKCSKSIDIIGLSIDSEFNEIEKKLGRRYKSNNSLNNIFPSHIELIKNKSKLIHAYNINLKINTTITPLNWKADMRKLINTLSPIRWKVLEVHKINGINDRFFEKYGTLKSWQFEFFIKKHSQLNPICETSKKILDSYCMITPDGRFYQDTDNFHHYSDPILKVGILKAFEQVQFIQEKYKSRNGDYFKIF